MRLTTAALWIRQRALLVLLCGVLLDRYTKTYQAATLTVEGFDVIIRTNYAANVRERIQLDFLLVSSFQPQKRVFSAATLSSVCPQTSYLSPVVLFSKSESAEESSLKVNRNGSEQPTQKKRPDLLQPYLPAADPNYKIIGPISTGTFIIKRDGEPTVDELANGNILKIVTIECTDLEVNTLVWKCLGYRFDDKKMIWTNESVFPKWKEQFPIPPDFIGMQRIYSPEIDKISLKANQALVKSIPIQFKQSLKFHLKPLGFKGYQYSELTPNKTRRAQCANWLLYYREELFGYTIEQLQERKRKRLEEEQQKTKNKNEETTISASNINNAIVTNENSSNNKYNDDWKPPVKEVI